MDHFLLCSRYLFVYQFDFGFNLVAAEWGRCVMSLTHVVYGGGKMNIYIYILKKNQNAPRPSEHPPVMGKNVKMFRWSKAANTKPLHGV